MKLPKKALIPCFLCGKPLPVKLTKKDKPYFVCDPCGLQVFVRGKSGIYILKRLLQYLTRKPDVQASGHTNSFDVLRLATRLVELQCNRQKLLDSQSIVENSAPTEGRTRALRSLDRRIRQIKKQMAKAP